MKRIEHMSLWERAYFPEIVRGMSVTGYHFFSTHTGWLVDPFSFLLIVTPGGVRHLSNSAL